MIICGVHMALKAGCACTGNMEIPQATNMGDLPIEMVELVLSKLSWPDLAPISSTCSAFKSASYQALSREQERRCDLALARFGRGRINRIADQPGRGSHWHEDTICVRGEAGVPTQPNFVWAVC
jgi:hypothetical protein